MGGSVGGTQVLADLSWLLPGLNDWVECPNSLASGAPRLDVGQEYCASHGSSIAGMVQHLNDSCKWTREQVADWLDALDADLTFPTEPPPRPEPRLAAAPVFQVAHDVSTCPICLGAAGMTGKYAMTIVFDSGAVVSTYYGVTSDWVVIDDFSVYQKIILDAYSIAGPDAWLNKKTEEEKQLEKLKADEKTPAVLKRPDGTTLPALDTDSFLKTTELLHPNIALYPGALKHLETEYPTSKDNLQRKGKHRGRHRRT